ncbi:hypothetical protein [Mesorhizobium sp. KR2-14]|uniref:hypothetical protein n=1 Tax=Mesorhizobium sp. KR2-14 TaxID=3156610 RepID=UPI0032B52545
MALQYFEWQTVADKIVAEVTQNRESAIALLPNGAKRAAGILSTLEVSVSDALNDAGFRLHDNRLEISAGGLNLIYEVGKQNDFGGLAEEEFCKVALQLYLFHEIHHVAQGLIEFEDVQALKRTAGPDKLGELDVIADTVAAQLFAWNFAATQEDFRRQYAAGFLAALHFMVEYCFPAFGFPLEKRHKVQRALGIVLMAIITERAIDRRDYESDFDIALYASFSQNFSELAVLSYGGNPSPAMHSVVRTMKPQSVKAVLRLLDSGQVGEILAMTRALV